MAVKVRSDVGAWRFWNQQAVQYNEVIVNIPFACHIEQLRSSVEFTNTCPCWGRNATSQEPVERTASRQLVAPLWPLAALLLPGRRGDAAFPVNLARLKKQKEERGTVLDCLPT